MLIKPRGLHFYPTQFPFGAGKRIRHGENEKMRKNLFFGRLALASSHLSTILHSALRTNNVYLR